MDTVVAELVNFFQAMKSGSLFHYLILLALVLIGLAAAVAYQRVVIKIAHGLEGNTGELQNYSGRPQRTCIGGQEAGRGPEETRAGGE